MTYSRTLDATIRSVADFTLRYTLDQMFGSAEQNAFDTVGEHSGEEYEEVFISTLEMCQARDYVDADQAYIADLAEAWIQAYPEAAKLSDIESVAALITTQRAEIALLKSKLS